MEWNGCSQIGQVLFSLQTLKHTLNVLESIFSEMKSYFMFRELYSNITNFNIVCMALDSEHISAWGRDNSVGCI